MGRRRAAAHVLVPAAPGRLRLPAGAVDLRGGAVADFLPRCRRPLSGAAIFIVALVGETVADRQLRRFAADPRSKGRVCDLGLWSVSRHPNYFFEWLGWIAYPLIAIGLPPGNTLGMIAFVGPIFMYWLLVYVSGVPPLEAHMERSRGEAFRAYQRRVNVFFPGPARRDAAERRSQPS